MLAWSGPGPRDWAAQANNVRPQGCLQGWESRVVSEIRRYRNELEMWGASATSKVANGKSRAAREGRGGSWSLRMSSGSVDSRGRPGEKASARSAQARSAANDESRWATGKKGRR